MARLGAAMQRLRDSRLLRGAARAGLAGRGVFYLLLSALAVNLLLSPRGETPQANANGALTEVARTGLGIVLLVAAAAGFTAFGVVRLAGAYADRRTGILRRVSTAGQALLYFLVAGVTVSFLLGRHSTGSEQQQRSNTARLLDLPAGRLGVAAIGLFLLGVCAWQVRVGLAGYYADSLETQKMSRAMRRVTALAAPIGIVARALGFAPIAGFLLVAAATADPRRSKGLDGLLLQLTGEPWGKGLVVLVAAGFLVFAGYSFLEAGYRQVDAGH